MARRADRISLFLPKAEADMLREHAKRRGFIIHSGQNIGEGSVSAFLRALARSEITMAADAVGGGEAVNLQEVMERLEYLERNNEELVAKCAELESYNEHFLDRLKEEVDLMLAGGEAHKQPEEHGRAHGVDTSEASC